VEAAGSGNISIICVVFCRLSKMSIFPSNEQDGSIGSNMAILFKRNQEDLIRMKLELQKSQSELDRLTKDTKTLRDQNKRLLEDQETLAFARRDANGKLEFRTKQVMDLELERTTWSSKEEDFNSTIHDLERKLSISQRELNGTKSDLNLQIMKNEELEKRIEDLNRNNIPVELFKKLQGEIAAQRTTINDLQKASTSNKRPINATSARMRAASSGTTSDTKTKASKTSESGHHNRSSAESRTMPSNHHKPFLPDERRSNIAPKESYEEQNKSTTVFDAESSDDVEDSGAEDVMSSSVHSGSQEQQHSHVHSKSQTHTKTNEEEAIPKTTSKSYHDHGGGLSVDTSDPTARRHKSLSKGATLKSTSSVDSSQKSTARKTTTMKSSTTGNTTGTLHSKSKISSKSSVGSGATASSTGVKKATKSKSSKLHEATYKSNQTRTGSNSASAAKTKTKTKKSKNGKKFSFPKEELSSPLSSPSGSSISSFNDSFTSSILNQSHKPPPPHPIKGLSRS
jgi:hypothetical protein